MEFDENPIITCITIIFIVACLVFGFIQPNIEKNIFNKCTGSNITYFDAVFGNFRAIECKK
jgi:hypothetical protein